MRVGCYQCECVPGDYDANAAIVLKGLREARNREVEIVAFPESFLTGYYSREDDARKNSFSLDSPRVEELLKQTAEFEPTWMVGFNERRGEQLFNTVMVVEKGRVLGTYSKAFPCFGYFTPGREFPVFERNGVKFGVIICADGAYIEPARILALKSARIIFAPHYNFLFKEWVIVHFNMVRHDHVARAVENGVWFLRANTIGGNRDEGLGYEGVGYGDSYLLDPLGQIAAHAGWHCRGLMAGEVDLERNFYREAAHESRASAQALNSLLADALKQSPPEAD